MPLVNWPLILYVLSLSSRVHTEALLVRASQAKEPCSRLGLPLWFHRREKRVCPELKYVLKYDMCIVVEN